MQEEDEDTFQAWAQVGVRMPPPDLPFVEDRLVAQAGQDQVAVDGVIEGKRSGVEFREALEPRGRCSAPPLEPCCRDVVKQVVVVGEPQRAGLHRVLGMVLAQELINEV